MNWIKFSNNVTPLALVAYLATRWRHLQKLQIWSPDGATCICCKFDHQMAQLAQKLVIRWHHLHCLQSWPPGCITWIATLPWIVLLALSVNIELVSSSARITSVKSQQGGVLTDGHPDPKIGPQVYLGSINISEYNVGPKASDRKGFFTNWAPESRQWGSIVGLLSRILESLIKVGYLSRFYPIFNR